MAGSPSNCNHFTRPPVIAVRDGRAWPLIRRETDEDLLRRDVG
jgi:diaminopimelate decarboxylase